MDPTSAGTSTTPSAPEPSRSEKTDGKVEGDISEAEMVDVDAEQDIGEWAPEHDAVLSSLVSTNTFTVPWPTLRALLKLKLRTNVEAFLAMPSHAPKPSGEMPPPVTVSSDVIEGGSKVEGDAMISEGSSSGSEAAPAAAPIGPPSPVKEGGPAAPKEDEIETTEARLEPGGLIGGRTLPAFIQRDEATVLEGRVRALLDGFENNPPFTVQRLAELLADPFESHASLGKYLRALLRVLDVHSEWTAPAVDGPGVAAAAESAAAVRASVPGASGGAWSIGTPLFSPIPFLVRDEADHVDATDGGPVESAMSPMALGSPLPIASSPPPQAARTSPLPSVAAPLQHGPPGSSPPTMTTGPPTTLSSDSLIVDELDGGLALSQPPSTASPSSSPLSSSSASAGSAQTTDVVVPPPRAHEGEGANQQAHLLAPTPRAFTSTTTTTSAAGGPTTPPSTTRVRPRAEDDEMSAPHGEGEEERFVRSKSPTPDVTRAKVTPGEGVAVDDDKADAAVRAAGGVAGSSAEEGTH